MAETIDAQWGTVMRMPQQEYVFKQGTAVTHVHYLRDAAVKLSYAERTGTRTIVGLRWSGWFLGTASAISGRPYSTDAITLRPSIIEAIPKDTFISQILNDTELNWRLHQSHSVEIVDAVANLTEMACLPSRQRFETLLHRFIDDLGNFVRLSDGRIVLPLNKSEISQLLGINPSTFSRLLADMAREGLIKRDANWIIVPAVRQIDKQCEQAVTVEWRGP